MAGLASTERIGVGLVPAEHRGLAALGRGPRLCEAPQHGQHQGRPWCWQELEPGARDKPLQRYPHNKRGKCLRSSSGFIESKAQSSDETQAFCVNLTPFLGLSEMP